jgi:hypothetical protein
MARKNNDSTGEDKAKIRILFAEVEGNNETVQEAMRTMISAMSRPVKLVQVQSNGEVKVLPPVDIQEENFDDDLALDDAHKGTTSVETGSSRRPRGTGPKVDRNASITLVQDLNFMPQGKKSLRDFSKEKSPATDMESILVVVYYMQHEMALPKIGLGHIRTALKDIGSSIPLSLRQTVHNMSTKKTWLKFTELEDITTATGGENHLIHDMGKKG